VRRHQHYVLRLLPNQTNKWYCQGVRTDIHQPQPLTIIFQLQVPVPGSDSRSPLSSPLFPFPPRVLRRMLRPMLLSPFFLFVILLSLPPSLPFRIRVPVPVPGSVGCGSFLLPSVSPSGLTSYRTPDLLSPLSPTPPHSGRCSVLASAGQGGMDRAPPAPVAARATPAPTTLPSEDFARQDIDPIHCGACCILCFFLSSPLPFCPSPPSSPFPLFYPSRFSQGIC
jgi:hypothetical protein